MKIIKSTIRTDKEGFNNCPPRKELKDGLKAYKNLIQFIDIVDRDYWSNSGDTLVLKTSADILIDILSWFTSPDEFDKHKLETGDYIARFWWD